MMDGTPPPQERVSPAAVLRRSALVGGIVPIGVARVPAYVLLQGRNSLSASRGASPPLLDARTGSPVGQLEVTLTNPNPNLDPT